MSKERDVAICHVLKEIDSNRKAYDSVPKRREMLARLIETYNLRAADHGRGLLTVEKLENMLKSVAQKIEHFNVAEDQSAMSTLFLHGSAVVPQPYLEKIGYRAQEGSPQVSESFRKLEVNETQAASTAPGPTGRLASLRSRGSSSKVAKTPAPSIDNHRMPTTGVSGECSIIEVADDSSSLTPLRDGSSRSSEAPAPEQSPGYHTNVEEHRQRKRPRTEVMALELVPDDTIKKELHRVWSKIENFSNALEARTRMSTHKYATAVLDPSDKLKLIYQTLFADNWTDGWSKMQPDKVTSVELVAGCTAAAVYQTVWKGPLPMTDIKQLIDAISPLESLANDLLSEDGSNWRLKPLLECAGQKLLHGKDFQKTIVHRAAVKLTDDFILDMIEQIFQLKANEVLLKDENEEWDLWKRELLVPIFESALLLRSRLEVASDPFKVKWIQSGERLNRDTMEDLVPMEGERKVKLSVSPQVLVEKAAGEWTTVATAKVFSMRA